MKYLSSKEVLRRYSDEYSTELSDVNQRETPTGDAPLHTACIRGRLDEVTALVEGGADVNMQGEEGYTPLHWAVAGGHEDIVRLLLQRDAEISRRNSFGKTPREIAIEKGFSRIVEILDAPRSR